MNNATIIRALAVGTLLLALVSVARCGTNGPCLYVAATMESESHRASQQAANGFGAAVHVGADYGWGSVGMFYSFPMTQGASDARWNKAAGIEAQLHLLATKHVQPFIGAELGEYWNNRTGATLAGGPTAGVALPVSPGVSVVFGAAWLIPGDTTGTFDRRSGFARIAGGLLYLWR